jgi:hypothetical protein
LSDCQIEKNEQGINLFQGELPRIDRESNLAFMDAVTAEYGDRVGGYRSYHGNGLDYGFCQQPDPEAYLFIL